LSVGKRTEVPDLPAIPPDTWFVFEIIANGPNVAYKLNGKPLVQEEGLTVRRGRIGLTVIGPIPGTVVSYKKIEIKELPASEPGWVRLFNGKDLTGWHQAEVHHHGEWTVAGGVLTGKTETGRLNVLYSDRVDFENFHLRTEVRTENSHGDLFFRTSPDVNIQGYSVAVTGFESPLRTGAVSVWTKNPLRFLPVLPGAPKRADRWVTLEVIANGSNIETFVDGTRITRATDATFRRGHLALNIPGFEIDGRPREGPKIIQFRKIEIKELPPSEPG
jgi:hypothetical protein